MSKAEGQRQADEWIRVGPAGFEDHHHQLSGGIGKRVTLAAALIRGYGRFEG